MISHFSRHNSPSSCFKALDQFLYLPNLYIPIGGRFLEVVPLLLSLSHDAGTRTCTGWMVSGRKRSRKKSPRFTILNWLLDGATHSFVCQKRRSNDAVDHSRIAGRLLRLSNHGFQGSMFGTSRCSFGGGSSRWRCDLYRMW